jgi:hypothetical protein
MLHLPLLLRFFHTCGCGSLLKIGSLQREDYLYSSAVIFKCQELCLINLSCTPSSSLECACSIPNSDSFPRFLDRYPVGPPIGLRHWKVTQSMQVYISYLRTHTLRQCTRVVPDGDLESDHDTVLKSLKAENMLIASYGGPPWDSFLRFKIVGCSYRELGNYIFIKIKLHIYFQCMQTYYCGISEHYYPFSKVIIYIIIITDFFEWTCPPPSTPSPPPS